MSNWQVVNNMTGLPVSKAFDTEDKAVHLCGVLNLDAYHQGMSGLYGVHETPGAEGGVISFKPGEVWLDPETGEFTRSDVEKKDER